VYDYQAFSFTASGGCDIVFASFLLEAEAAFCCIDLGVIIALC
jgi:hypothetical protein